MSAPAPRVLPPPSLATLNPPIRGYRYFEAAATWPFEADGGVDSARNRWWLAEHALLSYDEPAIVDATLDALGYRVERLHDRASSGHAHVALAADHAVLAFRGTEVLNPGDAPLKLVDVARDWLVDARFPRVRETSGGEVHGGFASAVQALWPMIEPWLDPPRRWWITGHSLGGALAALAALRLQQRGQRVEGVVTFGQPRCGDRAYAQQLTTLPLRRVVNGCDLVPRLPPPALGFKHAGTLLHLQPERYRQYGATVRAALLDLPNTLRHGIGALTPVALIDHAPLHYAILCHNEALNTSAPR